MRIRLIGWVVFFIFLFLGLGLFNLQVVAGRRYRELSDKNCIRLLPQEGNRGRILDRNGNLIAGSQLSYDVIVLPQITAGQLEAVFSRVSRVLNTGVDVLRKAYSNNFIGSFMPVTIANNITPIEAIALEESRFDLDGLMIQPRPVRFYPHAGLACHVLGYVDQIDRWRLTKLQDYGYRQKDIVGFGGVEEKYDYYLRQEEGGLSIEVDHRGRMTGVLGFRPPENGKDIQLTLDLDIQKIAEDALVQQKGCVIIMDAHSGEIYALASNPGFDPSLFIRKNNALVRSLFNDSGAPLLNRAISASYPPGSVFKLVVASAALEQRKINTATSVVCNGSSHIGNKQFNCWSTHGLQNIFGAIANSCNVFFYKIGILVGAQNIHDYALKFGFSKSTALDISYEASGNVPSPLWKKIYRFQHWYDGDTANLAIGQGDLLVTPLQVVRMTAVFANGGKLVTPYLIKAVGGHELSASKGKVSLLSLKESTINYVRQGMRDVVAMPHGTASILSGLPVSVAAKTGTAQVTRKQSHGWFTGFFPFKEPRYTICVFVEHGGAGVVASMVSKQIVERMSEKGII